MTLANRINKLEGKIPTTHRQALLGWSYETEEEVIYRFCQQHNVTDTEKNRVDWFVVLYEVINMDQTPHEFTEEEKASNGDLNAHLNPCWRRK